MKTIKPTIAILLALVGNSTIAASPKPPSNPNIYDSFMSKTVGRYKIDGSTYNYNVTGQLNYVYGFHILDSGFHNSSLSFATATSVASGTDLIVETGVKDIYQWDDSKYQTELDVSVKLSNGNHEFAAGYDMMLMERIFGTKVKMNSDATGTRNIISESLSEYLGYASYDFSLKNYRLSASVDSDGQLYGGISAYADGSNVKLNLFESSNHLGLFFDLDTLIDRDIRASFGVGIIATKWSFYSDVTRFMANGLSVFANFIGNEDYSVIGFGTEYSHRSVSVYTEGKWELNEYKLGGESQQGIVLGAKFVF